MGKELFYNIPSKVGDLLHDVRNGKIGLPDLQRPFVWPDTKVRELLDSMLKGYPIGYIMIWSSPDDYENQSHIGANGRTYARPEELIIDGQQRLTALLAAVYGIAIKDKNYKERHIRISFNLLSREFAVWTPAYQNNVEWVSEISEVFLADEAHEVPKYRKKYIKALNETREKNALAALTDDEEELIESNLNDLLDLLLYFLPTLKITAKADEENVADIFVRVNSGGQNLTEKNFIETLLAVYDNDVHSQINEFCEKSRIPMQGTSYNPILDVNPGHLIRVVVGVGFKRARLKYAYMLLRGKNLKTGKFSEGERTENLKLFRRTLNIVTDLNNWHAFLNLFAKAGFLSKKLIASSNAVIFSYVLYLIGKYEYKVKSVELNKIMIKWIFMSTVTLFYTGSTESEVEKQFADLRSISSSEGFVNYLNDTIKTRFNDDYFKTVLPTELVSSSTSSPAWYGYIAALNVLGVPILFGTEPLSQYFAPGTSGTKNAIDKHHIFPKHYLEQIGFKSDRERNQIANYTYLDYQANIDISDDPPSEYVERYKSKLGEDGYRKACGENALPLNFETLEYTDFLSQRRFLMAQIIRRAYEKLDK